ncbi:hypothetical protein [Actinokineospora sp.]|uniref:hypothetical protein n=1 Tax=Actinokineospora sp. TaxID=1872133 RepID=UPI0040376DBF
MSVTLADLTELLAESPAQVVPAEADSMFALDSLALTWMIHLIEERYGIAADPDDEALSGLTTVRAMHAHLCGLAMDRSDA